jgi:outer membrane protein
MNDLGQKMMDISIISPTKNGFAMVIDISNPQTPVLWGDPSIEITTEIVKLYDDAHTRRCCDPGASKPAGAAKPPATAARERRQTSSYPPPTKKP